MSGRRPQFRPFRSGAGEIAFMTRPHKVEVWHSPPKSVLPLLGRLGALLNVARGNDLAAAVDALAEIDRVVRREPHLDQLVSEHYGRISEVRHLVRARQAAQSKSVAA